MLKEKKYFKSSQMAEAISEVDLVTNRCKHKYMHTNS